MSSIAIHPPKTPVTKGINSIAAATLPNICKMPGPPAPFVPTPLPNIGKSNLSPQGYSTSVKFEGHPVAIKGASFGSMGDVASKGLGGGVVSMNCEGPTKFIAPGSLTVMIEGKNVHLLADLMSNNNGPSGSPANAATMMGTLHAPGGVVPPDIQAAADLCDQHVDQEVANGKLTTTGTKPNCMVKGSWKHKCCKDLLEKQYNNVACEKRCGTKDCRLDVAIIDPPGAVPSPTTVVEIFDFKFSCSGKAPKVGRRQRRKYRKNFPLAPNILAVGP